MLNILLSLLIGATAPVDTAHLRFDVTPVANASGFPDIAISLTMTGVSSDVRLRLPSEWAGRRELYRDILDLAPISASAVLATPGDSSLREYRRGAASDPVAVRWRLAAPRAGSKPFDGHNHDDLAAQFARLIGYDALVLPDISRGSAVHATFVFHGLARGSAIASSFGVPRDSVIDVRAQLGELQHAVYTFEYAPGGLSVVTTPVRGGQLTIAIAGKLRIPDSVLTANVRRVIDAERGFWGTPAPRSYLVAIGTAPRGTLGGTRLTNAFVADIDSSRAQDADVTALFAHELMHDWLGGTINPAPTLVDNELSWFTEGFTEYLSRRLLWQAKLISDSEYVTMINRSLREAALSPMKTMPWDTVIRRYWDGQDIKRQPYLRGEILALRLDEEIDRASGGRATLGDLMRQFLVPPANQDGWTREQVVAILAGQLGREPTRGLVDSSVAQGDLGLAPPMRIGCYSVSTVDLHRWDPGFDVDSSLATRTVRGVRAGSAAEQGGLRNGMTIRGANIWRGDVTKPIELTVTADSATKKISFSAAGVESVPVQQFSGC